jgi:hypothetical protein
MKKGKLIPTENAQKGGPNDVWQVDISTMGGKASQNQDSLSLKKNPYQYSQVTVGIYQGLKRQFIKPYATKSDISS